MNQSDDETWVIAENEESFFRFNKLPEIANLIHLYPFRMGVAIPVVITPDVNRELLSIEMFIESFLENDGVLVASIMGKKEDFKEFVFYVKEGLDYKDIHETIKTAFPKYEIQMYVNKDPEWSLFKEIRDSIHD